MAKKKQLTKKQLSLLDELFSDDADTGQVLKDHKITASVFNQWQSDENFAAEFDNRIAAMYRQSELIIARYATLAAAKLVQLTESESQETARKACLDIIQLPKMLAKKQATTQPDDQPEDAVKLSSKNASKILAVLAGK
ncbi:MAG: hypothetical protein FVQ80_10870 [Planctomycetes bacterium]|nr:hypothetical protein [Planctomycetota bacterium]